ncbi:hypothetical protein ABZP36_007907 [Zizania latifolia]
MDPHLSSHVHATAAAGGGAAAPNGMCRLNKEEDAAFVDVDVEAARNSVGAVCAASSVGLAGFGASGAYLGGANIFKSATRVLLGGWFAMLVTYGVLRLFGTLFHMDVSSSG